MAAYQLEATEGGQTYCIPQGETMIGRGPFLGISDKKVSRNHAILEVVDDKLRIKPIHVNPCFYRASHKGTFAPLEKDKWCWLHDGDCISLLPDKLSFRVIAHLLQEATLRNSQALDEGCALNNGSPHMTTDNGGQIEVEEPSCLHKDNVKPVLSPPSTKCDEKKVENGSDLSNVVGCKVDAEQSKPPQRKRTLPKWMLQGDLVVQSLPTPVVKAGKKRRNVRTDETEINVENLTKNKQSRAVKSKDNGEGGPIKKSKAAAPTEDLPGPSSDTLQARVEHKYSPKPVIDNEEEEEMEAECYDLSPCPSPKPESSSNGNATIKQHQSSNSQVISQSAKSPQTAQQVPKRRTPCMYAERCYRKNPVHFQEFSHPGDSDYHDVESGSQDDNDDRPECPYGTDCYRKNPQHKLEYKHTKPPGRRLRKRPAKKAKSALDDDSDNDGEPNEYDLEDSFIDDDDEEEEDITDEDSDWMPDSEEKDSEDVKQLLKEAKGFVKRKH